MLGRYSQRGTNITLETIIVKSNTLETFSSSVLFIPNYKIIKDSREPDPAFMLLVRILS